MIGYIPLELTGPELYYYGASKRLSEIGKPEGYYSWLSDGSIALLRQGSTFTVTPTCGDAVVRLVKEERYRTVIKKGLLTQTGSYGSWSEVDDWTYTIEGGTIYPATMDFPYYKGVVNKKNLTGAFGAKIGETWRDYQYRLRVVLIKWTDDPTDPTCQGGSGYVPPHPPVDCGPDAVWDEAKQTCVPLSPVASSWLPIAIIGGGVVVTAAVIGAVLMKKPSKSSTPS